MCRHGDTTMVCLSEPRRISGRQKVPVDSCIANFIQWLNSYGVRTRGCCCGHEECDASLLFEARSVWNWQQSVGQDHNILLQQTTYLLGEFVKVIHGDIFSKEPRGQLSEGQDVTMKRCFRLLELRDKAEELLSSQDEVVE